MNDVLVRIVVVASTGDQKSRCARKASAGPAQIDDQGRTGDLNCVLNLKLTSSQPPREFSP